MKVYIIQYGTRHETYLHFTHAICYPTKQLALDAIEKLKLKKQNELTIEPDTYVPNYYTVEELTLDKGDC